MNEEIKKNLPFIIGGVVVIGGIIFFIRKTGSSQGIGYTAIAPADRSAEIQAVTQTNAQVNEMKLQSFLAFTTFLNNRELARLENESVAMQTEYAYRINQDNNNTLRLIKQAEANTQLANIRAQEGIAKRDSNNRTFASILSTVAAFALFCYETTDKAAQARIPYTHGIVSYE